MRPDKKSIFILIFCYAFWGFQPLYWALNDTLDSYTLLACRIIMAAVFSVLILAVAGRLDELGELFRNKRMLRFEILAAIFLLLDWGVFIVAVNGGHVLDVSIGYYVNPLLLFGIGIVIYKERCTKAQIIALGIAVIGIIISTVAFGSFPMLSVVIAINWAVYAALKKNVRADGVVSIAAETLIMSPVAIIFLLLCRRDVIGSLNGIEILFVIGSGIVTALPMFLYSYSVCRFSLIVMCFVQYLSPTFNMICGFITGERFSTSQLVSLVFFIAASVVFTVSQIQQQKKPKRV